MRLWYWATLGAASVADVALAMGRPLDKVNETARVLIDWAKEHHGIGSTKPSNDPAARQEAGLGCTGLPQFPRP